MFKSIANFPIKIFNKNREQNTNQFYKSSRNPHHRISFLNCYHFLQFTSTLQQFLTFNNIITNKMTSQINNNAQNSKKSQSKFTTTDQDKKQSLMKKIILNDIDGIRKINIKSIDLNIFQPNQSLQFIDEHITPLIYCAYYGRTEIAKQLLANKFIDIDLETKCNKHTPLIVACMGANYEMVKFLLGHNAEVNKPNALSQTPLVVTIFRLIQQYNSFENKRICFKIADVLINNGADINWIINKQKGYTLLHFLTSSTMKLNKIQKQLNYDIIKFLIQKGADINLKTLNQKKPEDLVLTHCNVTQLLELILKHKQLKNVKTKNSLNLTPKQNIIQQITLKKKNRTMFKDMEDTGTIFISQNEKIEKHFSRPQLIVCQSKPQSRGQQIESTKWKFLAFCGIKKK